VLTGPGEAESYGELVLVSVHCVTGPTNFDAATGEVEFEAGARSHVFHLLYRALPTLERLSGISRRIR